MSQLANSQIGNIGSGNWTAGFNYEDNGDMNSRTITGTGQTDFTYSGNEMAAAGSANLGYDENGNLTVGRRDANISVSLAYNWDNKLRSATIEGNSISLKYDPAGNRIQKNSSVNGNRKYIVDIAGGLPVILLEIDPTDMSVKKGYIYANSEILAQYDGGSASRYYFLHDRLGSVRQVINSDGVVVKMLTYNPFGETIEEDGTFYTPWQFTGQYLDSETGQYYLRARQYSPYLSRFTGRDLVIGDFESPLTLHKYLYCQNDPINNFDLNGRWTEELHRGFGELGNPDEPGSLFDYARLDKDMPATDPLFHPDWNKLHFLSREDALPGILLAIGTGSMGIFEYGVHMWQDSYVHHDNKYTWIHPPVGVDEHTEKNHAAYVRCDDTTRQLEKLWKDFNDEEGMYHGFGWENKLHYLQEMMWHRSDGLSMTDDTGRKKYIVDY